MEHKPFLNIIPHTEFGASFSDCRKYRYTLWRRWNLNGNKLISFIGLNPSTADETKNDPTVTRCINYAKTWGFDGMVMLNIFSYRATDPKIMKQQNEPIGERNDYIIINVGEESDKLVCCWGTHGAYLNRGNDVINGLKIVHPDKLFHLGLSKHGFPKHPLYLSSKLTPIPFEP